MAQFLRDIHIANVKISEDTIVQLTEVFASRARTLDEMAKNKNNKVFEPLMYFVIRFDGKGYRLFSADEVLHHFRRADVVERLIITVETSDSFRSNRRVGTHLEARFDRADEKICYLSVTSDDANWVDASYNAVQEIIAKHRTRNGLARSGWSTLMVQIFGVIVGFSLSLWAASRIAPSLAIENAFIITFFFALLIFSNAWGYINNLLLSYIHSVFPNVQFYRPDKDRVNWLMQGVIGGVATALTLYLLNLVFGYISNFITEIPK